MSLTVRMLCCSAILALSAVGQVEGAETFPKEMQGTWIVKSISKNGRTAPMKELDKVRFVVDKDTMVLQPTDTNEEPQRKFKFVKTDATKNPNQIDLEAQFDPYVGKKVNGIYELKGDELKLCFPSGPDGARPSKFAAPMGSKLTLVELKRAMKK